MYNNVAIITFIGLRSHLNNMDIVSIRHKI